VKEINIIGQNEKVTPTLRRKVLLLSGSMILFGMIIGLMFGFWLDEDVVDILSERRLKGSYQFINPLLECDSSLGEKNIKLRNMEYLIKTYIDQVVRSGKVDTVAVYFRDLNNGPWMGINEDDEFAGASLLKLPLAMAVYKKSESNIGLLGTMVAYKEDKNSNNTQTFDLDMKLKLGKKYTLEELIERMLVNSDNEAKLLVEKFITGAEVANFFEELGIHSSVDNNYDISVREYGAFFRILYNSSYLSRENSEKILRILSKVSYSSGLKKWLPEGTVLSHKFGEKLIDGSGQLHDCGMVYRERPPYLICVMTRGSKVKEMEKVIAEISKKVYTLSE